MAQKVVEQEIGRPSEFVAGTAATDASEYIQAGDFPIIILGPGAGTTDHEPNEYIEVNAYLAGCRLYQELARQFWSSLT